MRYFVASQDGIVFSSSSDNPSLSVSRPNALSSRSCDPREGDKSNGNDGGVQLKPKSQPKKKNSITMFTHKMISSVIWNGAETPGDKSWKKVK